MPQLPKREPRLAINLLDLDRVDPMIRGMLLGGKLDLTQPIRMDPLRPDEIGVAFACDDLTAGTICDIVRNHDKKVGDYPTRAYIKRQKWSRVPGDLLLTLVQEDKVSLNPKLFAVEVEAIAPVVPERRRLEL